jgi:dolichyl-diphosphooligosaccharide--protein glycosyltransferase
MKRLSPEDIDKINAHWDDNELTSLMWELISDRRVAELIKLFQEAPEAPHMRSSDGRGPMWWAFEYKRTKIVDILKKMGVSDQLTDAEGRRPGE